MSPFLSRGRAAWETLPHKRGRWQMTIGGCQMTNGRKPASVIPQTLICHSAFEILSSRTASREPHPVHDRRPSLPAKGERRGDAFTGRAGDRERGNALTACAQAGDTGTVDHVNRA